MIKGLDTAMMDRDDDVVDRYQVDLAPDERGIQIVGILRLDGFEREMEPLATPSESGMAGVGFDASAFGFAQLQTRRNRVKRPPASRSISIHSSCRSATSGRTSPSRAMRWSCPSASNSRARTPSLSG